MPSLNNMEDVKMIYVLNNGLPIEAAVKGAGKPIVFVHGWPESWYSWRHQIKYFSERGYKCIAINVRGYGGSYAPAEFEKYTLNQIASDVATVIDKLAGGKTILVGHDMGAMIVYRTTIMFPDKVEALIQMSVPPFPQTNVSEYPVFDELGLFHYQGYMIKHPSAAVDEANSDLFKFIKGFFFIASGEITREVAIAPIPSNMVTSWNTLFRFRLNLMNRTTIPEQLTWASDDDIAIHVANLKISGMRGPMNKYRALDLDVDEWNALNTTGVFEHPYLFIGGEVDAVRFFGIHLGSGDDLFVPNCFSTARNLKGIKILDNCGHWISQEKPDETNAHIKAFLDSLKE